MSHFTVAVFAKELDDVEKLLAPFEESPDLPSPYVKFYEDDSADVDEDTGRCGYWVNPNAKWDWWEIGGRWNGLLHLKDGAKGILYDACGLERQEERTCNVARMCDVEFGVRKDDYNEALRRWDAIMGDAEPKNENEKCVNAIYKRLFITNYKTREKYATEQSKFSVYAYITPDGKWKAPGTMGWFGVDDANNDTQEAYERELDEFIEKNKDGDLIIAMVDCHI